MAKLTVLGIGNVLMRDEGIGVRLMEAVRDERPWPVEVEFIDGGAGGLNLLHIIEEAHRLVVFDAADMGLEPGQARVVVPEQVIQENLDDRISLHRIPFIETLKLAQQFFRRPPTSILAVQVQSVEYGRELSSALQAALPELAQKGIELIDRTLKEPS